MKLSVLRDIAWQRWDPSRLNGSEGGWRRSDAADEYDRYLMRVANDLQGGERDDVLVDYLVEIEMGHMGLIDFTGARSRAEATVAAIRRELQDSG